MTYAFAEIIEIIIEFSVEGFSLIELFEMIIALAPVAPVAFGFHDFYLLRKYLNKKESKES